MAINPLAIGGGVVAAAAVVGGGLYAGGVFGGSNNSGQGGGGVVKESRSIKDESETYSEKFGGKYAYYFLSTKDNVNTKTWALKAASVASTSQLANETFFTEVKNKTEKNERITALKDKCKEKYGEDEGADKADAWKEVWKFCSLFSTKPTTIDEAKDVVAKDTTAVNEKNYSDASNNKLGKTHKAKLISTYDPANTEFWKIRDVEFKADDINKGSSSTYFDKNKTEKPDIKTLCRTAYELESAADNNDTTTSPTQANLLKYCTLKGQ